MSEGLSSARRTSTSLTATGMVLLGTMMSNRGLAVEGSFNVLPNETSGNAPAAAPSTPPAAPSAPPERIHEIAERGSQVMPFDLKQTQHVFTKTPGGGVQRVLIREGADAGQVKLVREHLRTISNAFGRGDFSDPARIHGESMPGLATLKGATRGSLTVGYRDLPTGGEITYTSRDPAIIKALHDWFDAQLMDHGPDAVSGSMHDHAMHHHPAPQ